jgi:nucleotide-binding universal stress UspA family protein
MFKNIVVGTDGSPTASEAVEQAILLAATHGAQLHVVAAYRVTTMAMAAPEAMAAGVAVQVQAEQSEGTERLLKEAESHAKASGVEVSTHAIGGEPADAIIDVADEYDADLIVVGNRGMAGARRFLLGSVPNRVSHHAGCSVMIVRTC